MKDNLNIVWIYCDELRTDALGCYGNLAVQVHTPNLDRLASSGVRLVQKLSHALDTHAEGAVEIPPHCLIR